MFDQLRDYQLHKREDSVLKSLLITCMIRGLSKYPIKLYRPNFRLK
jgi:hypothetical protein